MEQSKNREESLNGLKQHANGPLGRIVALPPGVSDALALRKSDHGLSGAHLHSREYLNAVSPITVLPPEILATIFDFYVHEYSASANETSASAMSFSVVESQRRSCTISHVCRHWRAVALNTASLWSAVLLAQRHPGGREDQLSQTFLERSRRTSLDIEIPWHDPDTERLRDQLVSLLGRVRTLKIKNISHARLKFLAQLDCPAPMLETLQICLNYLPGSDAFLAENFPQELPTLFAGQTPQLKHLDIDLFTLFSKNRFENLTYIRFDSQRYRSIHEVKRLFTLMETSPHLEQLSFRSCNLDPAVKRIIRNSNIPIRFSSSGEGVVLCRLRHLDFDDCDRTFVNTLMSQIKIPWNNIIISSINCPRGSVLETLVTIPDPNASSEPHRPPLTSITSIHVSFDHSESVLIKASGPDTAIWVSYRDEQLANYYWFNEDVYLYLSRTFPLHTITELKLDGFDERTSDDWLNIFYRLSELKRLVLHIFPGYPQKWMYTLVPGLENYNASCPVPKLSELCIYPPISKAWDSLVTTMEVRASLGHPVDTLRVMLPSGLEGSEAEACGKTFERWKAKRSELEAYVREVVFEEGDGYFLTQGVPEANRPYMTENQLSQWIS